MWSRLALTLLVFIALLAALAQVKTSSESAPPRSASAALDAQSTMPKAVTAVDLSSHGGGWEASASGIVTPFGGAKSFGSLKIHANASIVGMAATPSGRGYWLVASDGGVFTFGNAGFYGSTGNIHLNAPIVGMAATPDGRGYWLVASDGGVFNAGDAGFDGSLGNLHLNAPVVGMAATPDGRGYWLVASDGGIFTAGDARFYGSLGNLHLNAPIVGMAATPDGRGYWLVASDGGVFTTGDARFYGSGPARRIGGSFIAMVALPTGLGYDLIDRDGTLDEFDAHSPSPAPQTTATQARPAPSSTSPTTISPPSSSTTLPTSPPDTGFVAQNGASLTLNGQPYRFTGINIYMAASGGTPSSCGGELYPNVSVPLSDMPNGIVFRFWAFQSFFVSNGSFNWANLDQVLAIAAAHDDKVIPVLANQWDYCDGPAKDLDWYQKGYDTTIGSGDLVTYRQFVADIVSRYADNPTVAMWQLVNEGQAINDDGSCNEPAAFSALLGFANDVGGLVHSIGPNLLVSLGVLEGWAGSGGGLQWCGAADSDYQSLMASPGNNVCDYHDYGYPTDPMGTTKDLNLAKAIEMCHADNKPIMVAETGIYADNQAALGQRAAEFRAKFAAQFQAGVVGELLWEWNVKPNYVVPDAASDYGIAPGDPSLGLLGAT